MKNTFKLTQEEKDLIIKTFEEKFNGWGIYEIDFVDAIETSDCDVVFVDIEGDWKHAHGYADHLMDGLGYSCEYQKVTEENGSDWYSATHGYLKKAWL